MTTVFNQTKQWCDVTLGNVDLGTKPEYGWGEGKSPL